MSTRIPATPSATILSINAHWTRFQIGTFAHHRTLGWCEVIGLPRRLGWRTVRWEEHQENAAWTGTIEVRVTDLQPLTEWREFTGRHHVDA